MPAARRIFARMERNCKMPTSAPHAPRSRLHSSYGRTAPFVLPPHMRAQAPRRRPDQAITAGQGAHAACLHELVVFMAKVPRNQARGEE
jgi:hypothetical protein